MTDHHIGFIELSAPRDDGLDCFEPESKADDQPRPRRQTLHEEAPQRPKARGRRQRRRLGQRAPVFEWSLPLSVFMCGLLVGTMLARPVTSSTTPIKGLGVARPATGPLIPASMRPAVVSEERGTAGSDAAREVDAGAGPDSAKVVDRQRARAVVPVHRGTLIVTSMPRGARVYVNNQLAGQTPLVMRGLAAGSRAVRIDLDGYARWSRGIQVVANQSTTVSAHLAGNQ